ncbi:uncharacterized protein B0H18DRAFT_1130051 [Fomitopsis serialis]|uniref:uncharacterized protein n=1 Tax=Fomitopsis serialis TaxID=139415 RepID=UPI0020084334|nr:uncharacterized protein B0H18DRAFT_1130051 [Neoantrodia serialis]KAH9910484.1 hypothetical protein B0H18DRAFT_1130051 [Neoantrodia serialis]
MHFSALVALAALVASPFALAQASDTVYVVYGNGQQFEDPTASVDTLTCGSVLAAEDSPLCSQCVVLGWQGRDVTVRIVDTSSEGGFVVTEGRTRSWWAATRFCRGSTKREL